MINENRSVFFADFGVPCVKGGTTAQVILDMPDQQFSIGSMEVLSTDYSILFLPSTITLLSGDSITVNAISYTVREINLLDDGAIARATLTKV